jgi:hypothetical protein
MDNQSESDNKIPAGIKLTQEAIEILDRLFDTAPPNELRDNLLEIYHTYLIHVHNTLPLNFDKLSMNMYHLIQSLGALSNARK